jgi:hypothetical protein
MPEDPNRADCQDGVRYWEHGQTGHPHDLPVPTPSRSPLTEEDVRRIVREQIENLSGTELLDRVLRARTQEYIRRLTDG